MVNKIAEEDFMKRDQVVIKTDCIEQDYEQATALSSRVATTRVAANRYMLGYSKKCVTTQRNGKKHKKARTVTAQSALGSVIQVFS